MTEKQKTIIKGKRKEYKYVNYYDPNGAFLAGAAAMDELDKWISVESGELPPQEPQDHCSKNVLVYTKLGFRIDSYDHEAKCWWSSMNVTHWQPIQPPKK